MHSYIHTYTYTSARTFVLQEFVDAHYRKETTPDAKEASNLNNRKNKYTQARPGPGRNRTIINIIPYKYYYNQLPCPLPRIQVMSYFATALVVSLSAANSCGPGPWGADTPPPRLPPSRYYYNWR